MQHSTNNLPYGQISEEITLCRLINNRSEQNRHCQHPKYGLQEAAYFVKNANQLNLVLGLCHIGYISPTIRYKFCKVLRRILSEWHDMPVEWVVN